MADLLPKDLLDGKVVFISGGGSGVNLAIARVCAEVGANIAICGRTEGTLLAAAEELESLGAQVSTSVADVRDSAAVTAAFADCAERLGPVDALVCGAAGNFLAPAEKISSNGFRAVMDIDLLGSFHCVSAAYEQLAATKGSVLFVSGGQSTNPYVHQAHVAAAKAGVDQLMRTLAVEWGARGVRSNSIIPGPVKGTEGMRRLVETADESVWTRQIPLGRFADGDEIGRMAAILLSPLGSYVNGSQVVIDGGMGIAGTGGYNQTVLDSVKKV